MTRRVADFYPERINMRVPKMSYHADLVHGAPNPVSIGSPAAAATVIDVDNLTSANATVDITSGVETTLETFGEYGVALTIEGGGATTAAFTVTGKDYLGQKIVTTGALNGTTPVAINKAYTSITQIDVGANNSGQVVVKTVKKFGLPFKVTGILSSYEDGAQETTGTVTVGVATQTATSSDPRGLFVPNGTPNGTKVFSGVFTFDFDNLHGAAHYAG